MSLLRPGIIKQHKSNGLLTHLRFKRFIETCGTYMNTYRLHSPRMVVTRDPVELGHIKHQYFLTSQELFPEPSQYTLCFTLCSGISILKWPPVF